MFKRILRDAGVVAAATIGAGIFALPYVFVKSGFWVGVFYLLALGIIVVYAHLLYWRVLDSTGGARRLLGLIRDYLGRPWYGLGFTAVIVGLILTLVIYLILGGQSLRVIWPSLGGGFAVLLFWLASVAPLLLRDWRIIILESWGAAVMAAIIFLIFLAGGVPHLPSPTSLNFGNLFLPFGILLFALAGWTAIEPLYAISRKKRSPNSSWKLFLSLGTIFSGLLYLMFVFGILALAPEVTSDTISGFVTAPSWQRFALVILSLLAIWTSYVPISLEIKNALERDLGWRRGLGLVFVVFTPLILVLFGLNNFLKIIGLAGGVFLSLQYLLILLVARRALRLSRLENFALSIAAPVFILGAIYEVYYFVVG